MNDDDLQSHARQAIPSSALPVGATLRDGQYTIGGKLDRGGFGIAYRALDNLNRTVAIKECFPMGMAFRTSTGTVTAATESVVDILKTARQMFLREAKFLANLTHPNIVQVQAYFEENDTSYMVMEFIHGQDLLSLIETQPEVLTPDFVLEIATHLLHALEHIHENGVLHRDIKPSNIRVDNLRWPTLIDFGAARQQTGEQARGMTSFRVVSDGYSPAEMYVKGARIVPASDLYAFAATLYHAITRTQPLPADQRTHEFAVSNQDPYQPIAGRYPAFNAYLLALIDASMAPIAAERPQSAAQWLDTIASGTAAEGSKTSRQTTAGGTTEPPPRKRGISLSVLALLLGTVLGVSVLGWWAWWREPTPNVQISAQPALDEQDPSQAGSSAADQSPARISIRSEPQSAILYDDGEGSSQTALSGWEGTAIWELAESDKVTSINGLIDIPSRGIGFSMRLSPDPDRSIRWQFAFDPKNEFPHGGISQLSGVFAKTTQYGIGNELNGTASSPGENQFRFDMASSGEEFSADILSLREGRWLELRLNLSNDSFALVTIELGEEGASLLQQALDAWDV